MFAVYKGKNFTSRAWYQHYSSMKYKFKELEILDNITETENDHFCTRYIDQKTHTTSSYQIRTVIPFYKQETKLNVLLKESPTTTGKKVYWPKYMRKCVATQASNGHQHVIDKKSGCLMPFKIPLNTKEKLRMISYSEDLT